MEAGMVFATIVQARILAEQFFSLLFSFLFKFIILE